MSTNMPRTPKGARADARAPEPAAPSPAVKNRPVHTERIGHIKASVWANDNGQAGVFYSVTFTRIYRDAEGNWQSSESFGRDDLLVLAKVADRAHSWICATLQGPAPDGP